MIRVQMTPLWNGKRSAGRTRHWTVDGLRSLPDEDCPGAWRRSARAGEKCGKHPVLFNDNLGNGFRLAGLTEISVAEADRHLLLRLLIAAPGYLNQRALR
jgi:hypothetical protein